MAYDPKNPQAFPRTKITEGAPGMPLRDWFAGQALAGLVMLAAATEEEFRPDRIALMAGDIADAMLKARES